ncbi:MAG: hypothetical protein AAGA69_08665 [Pseudomonadota bacterium]
MKTPWHLWVVGILAVLWNAGGCYDYIMTVTENPEYLAQMTEEQREAYSSMPVFYYALYAIAIWGAMLGSIALLLRKNWAVPLFMASLGCMAVNFIYGIFLAETKVPMTSMQIGFTAAIVLIAVFLLAYSRSMARAGHLR